MLLTGKKLGPKIQYSSAHGCVFSHQSGLFKVVYNSEKEQIFQNIKQEYSRYQRRRQLEISFNQSEAGCSSSDGQSPSTVIAAPSSPPGASSVKKDQPSFSLRQVGFLCECLLKDHEEKIREEYEHILNTKLADLFSKLDNKLKMVFAFCCTLCFVNSTVNPLVYALRSKDMRQVLLGAVARCRGQATFFLSSVESDGQQKSIHPDTVCELVEVPSLTDCRKT
ncbi:Akirin-1 [Acipenser ruthenus]|uniref:Akirin-1 n=1 Tax=Acipenser ruthenus TaxID=7906 RepID=A0A444USS1_ACIRT|nr:Akirin-1 [Acipenser ruthenus]